MGGNFVATKFAVAEMPPLLFNGIRFTLTACILIPYLRHRSMEWTQVLPYSLLFALNFCLGTLAIGYGLDIPTTVIVVQLLVPVSCLLGAWFHADRLGPWRWSGMLLAFAGVVLVAGTPSAELHPLGFCFALAAAVIGAIFNVSMKTIQVGTFEFMAWMSLFSAPQLLLASWWWEASTWPAMTDISLHTWLSLFYTVLLNTLLAHGIWVWMLQKHPVSQVAPFSLLVPVFGIALSQWFFADTLPPGMWQGAVLTLCGVTIIVLRRPAIAIRKEV